jgi:hypothetical protein
MDGHPELADKLAAFENDDQQRELKGRILFAEHLPIDKVQLGLQSGVLKQGTFEVCC